MSSENCREPAGRRAARRRGVKTAVVNGRVSDNSARRYLRLRAVARPLLALVDKYLMQTDLDAERIIAAGASRDRVGVAGNIKFDLDIASAGPPPTRSARWSFYAP